MSNQNQSLILNLLVIASSLCYFSISSLGSSVKGVYYNPIFENKLTPDPFVYFHTDGFYYYSHSHEGNEIVIFKSKTLTDFRTAENATVYRCPTGLCGELWAPEIHFVQNNFYIYFTMKDETPLGHKMYVIGALNNTDPLGNYSAEIKLTPTTEDFYAIDATVLQHSDGKLYLIYSGSHNGTENFPQKLFISAMSSPTQLSGPRILLKGPSYPWESKVNEGPEIIQRGNRTFIVYSSYCIPEGQNANYCLLMMFLDANRDPLVPGNWWHKTDGPVFWRNDLQGVYGPGHASFTYSPDKTETWIVYHAVEIPDDGSWNNRTARTEQIFWSSDNYPIFPRPSGLSVPLQTPSGQDD